MAGRGSFIESFPLFGYSLDDYNELFAEKLELLLKIRESERVSWSGKHRAPLNGLGVYPRPVQQPLPVWVAVGGTPQSVIRAGTLVLPLALAIIGGMPERFAPLIELYRESAERAGHDPAKLAVGINSHAFVADGSRQAADDFFPPYAEVMTRIGRERGVAADHAGAVRGVAGAARRATALPRGMTGQPDSVRRPSAASTSPRLA